MGTQRDVLTVLNEQLASTTSEVLDLDGIDRMSVQYVTTDVAPAAITFVDADVSVANNTITGTAHGYVTGLKVAATTAGVLPGGLSATNYYVIKIDADTIKLASSLANAEAGTAVDITSAAGGGTHTLTPATASGNVLKLQESNDGTNYVDISGKTVTAATTATGAVWDLGATNARYVKVLYTPSAGQLTVKVFANRITQI